MNPLPILLTLLSALSSVAIAGATVEPLLPRPLILQYPSAPAADGGQALQLRCASWRLAAEANNLRRWGTVPAECGPYVGDYVTGPAYLSDLEMVAAESLGYARSVALAGDGMDAWVFDIDETLLSNVPYYADHGFGLETFDGEKFDQWVDKAIAPAIEASLKLYEEILSLGYKIILLTGRNELQRSVTLDNLKKSGYHDWDKLILRGASDQGKHATVYKSEKRRELIEAGYRILGNSGDQWSDLLGSSMGERSFKLPNPMYYIH